MGIDPSLPVPPEAYAKAALAVRTPKEIVTDGSRLVRAHTARALRILQVEPKQATENMAVCQRNECGSYGTLANGDPVCHRCNCSGKRLAMKTKTKGEVCPAGLWSNK